MLFALLIGAVFAFGERPVSDAHLAPEHAQQFVASNGRNSVAVFSLWRSFNGYIFRTLFDREGRVVDDVAVWSSSSPVTGIATDGDRYLAALREGGALLLDGGGNFLRFIATPPASAVASNGSGFALALTSPSAVQLLDRDGMPAGAPIPTPDNIRAIAGAGSDYIVVTATSVRMLRHGVLSEPNNAQIERPTAAAVASNGREAIVAVRYGNTFLIPVMDGVAGTPVSLGDIGSFFSVFWTGTNFVVSNDSHTGTYVAYVTSRGVVLRREQVSAEHGVVAWDGGRFLFVSEYVTRFAATQSEPHVATDGESVLVAWREPYYTLHLSFIGPDGSHAETTSIDLGNSFLSHAAIAFDGRGWIIAHTSPRGLAVRQMTRDGSLTGETIAGTGNILSVRVASAGDGHFAIVWETTDSKIFASIDGRRVIAIASDAIGPDVASAAGAFRLAWSTRDGVTFATLYMDGNLVIRDKLPSGWSTPPRVARDLAVYFDDFGVPTVRRGALEVQLKTSSWYADPPWSAPGFATDDDGNAVIALESTAVLLSNDDRQSYVSVPGAHNCEVVRTHDAWLMVYTREVEERPYVHASRVFIRSLDFGPAPRGRPSGSR